MNTIQIVIVSIGSIALYEFFIKPYLWKRRITKIDNWTISQADMISAAEWVTADNEKKSVESLLRVYQNTNFDRQHTALKFEVAKMMYLYVNTVFRILTQHGIQMTAIDKDDASGTVEKLTSLEKQREQLEAILKNTFEYVKDSNNE